MGKINVNLNVNSSYSNMMDEITREVNKIFKTNFKITEFGNNCRGVIYRFNFNNNKKNLYLEFTENKKTGNFKLFQKTDFEVNNSSYSNKFCKFYRRTQCGIGNLIDDIFDFIDLAYECSLEKPKQKPKFKPQLISDVYSSNKNTIVVKWSDDTQTKAIRVNNDKYDLEKALYVAALKKCLSDVGYKRLKKEFDYFIKKYK